MMNKAAKCISAAAFLASGYGISFLQHRLDMEAPAGVHSAQVFGKVAEEEMAAVANQIQAPLKSPAPLFSGTDFAALHLLALAALVIAVLGRRRRRPGLTHLAVLSASSAAPLSPSLERTAAFRDNCEKRIIPRHLLRNPYGPETQHLSFEDRVQIAIEASLRESRVIGAICFRVDCFRQIGNAEPQVPGQGNLEVLAAFFRKQLRLTDCVLITGPDEIMVFISLLDILDHLRSIAGRLAAAAIDGKHLLDWQVSLATGTAMYPIDGYTSSEMIWSSRNRLPRNGSAHRSDTVPLPSLGWFPALLTAGSKS